MSHSVEAIYQKVQVLQVKALELHRERYRVQGTYDQAACKIIMDDIKALASDITHGSVDFDIDFVKTK